MSSTARPLPRRQPESFVPRHPNDHSSRAQSDRYAPRHPNDHSSRAQSDRYAPYRPGSNSISRPAALPSFGRNRSDRYIPRYSALSTPSEGLRAPDPAVRPYRPKNNPGKWTKRLNATQKNQIKMRLVLKEIPGAVAKRTTKYFKRLYSQIPEQVAKEAVRRQSLVEILQAVENKAISQRTKILYSQRLANEVPKAVEERAIKHFKKLYSPIAEEAATKAAHRQSLLDLTTDQPPNLEGDYVPASPVSDVASTSVDDDSFSSIDDILPPPLDDDSFTSIDDILPPPLDDDSFTSINDILPPPMEDDSFRSSDDAPPADDHSLPPMDETVPPPDNFPPPMDEDESDLSQDDFAFDDILPNMDEDFSASPDISGAGLTSPPISYAWMPRPVVNSDETTWMPRRPVNTDETNLDPETLSPFKCPFCPNHNFTYKNKKQFRKHLKGPKKCHGNPRPRCLHCSSFDSNLSYLALYDHIEQHHPNHEKYAIFTANGVKKSKRSDQTKTFEQRKAFEKVVGGTTFAAYQVKPAEESEQSKTSEPFVPGLTIDSADSLAWLTSLPFEAMIKHAGRPMLQDYYRVWIGVVPTNATKAQLEEALLLYASLLNINGHQRPDASTGTGYCTEYRIQGPVYSSAWTNNVPADAIIFIKRWSSNKSVDAVALSLSNAKAIGTQFTTQFVSASKTPTFNTLALVQHQLFHDNVGHFVNAIEPSLRTLSTTGTTVLMLNGMDGLTVNFDHLRVLRARWPRMRFILAVRETFRRLRYTAGTNELSADQDLRVRIADGWDLIKKGIFCGIFDLDVLLAQSLLASHQRDPHHGHLVDWWEYLLWNRRLGKLVYEGGRAVMLGGPGRNGY